MFRNLNKCYFHFSFREVNEDNVLFRNVLMEFEESFKYVSTYFDHINYFFFTYLYVIAIITKIPCYSIKNFKKKVMN